MNFAWFCALGSWVLSLHPHYVYCVGQLWTVHPGGLYWTQDMLRCELHRRISDLQLFLITNMSKPPVTYQGSSVPRILGCSIGVKADTVLSSNCVDVVGGRVEVGEAESNFCAYS